MDVVDSVDIVDRLSHHEITLFFLSLGILLGAARIFGELATRLNQPAVLGELLAGVLLGPTVLGALRPDLHDFFFPAHGGRAFAMDSLFSLCVVLFLLVAGLEVDLSTIWRQGRTALTVSVSGIIFPLGVGFAAAWIAPQMMGREPGADRFIFALFFGIALAITAMPVIAKTLMDLNLYHSDLGMIVMASAAFDDLTGWIVFSVLLSMMQASGEHGLQISERILFTLGFVAVVLTIGRALIHRVLPWILAHSRWPAGVLGFAFTLAFLGAAFTDWIGIHAIFGAFLVGVAIGDSRHFTEHTRSVVSQFIGSVFAPLFFASIGLRVDFVANFDPLLCLVVFVIACACKVLGCGWAALWSGVPRREAWAIAFCMNTRGVMEIILGLLALHYGLISERMFVALTMMSIATSVIVGPIVQRILRRKKPALFTDFLRAKAFINPLRAGLRDDAIRELSAAVCASAGIDAAAIESAVLSREETMPTGLGRGLAAPHARIEKLVQPIVGVGISESGVDFDAADGRPANLIFLLLTPAEADGAQMEIMADIARTFKNPEVREASLQAGTYTEFLALLKSRGHAAPQIQGEHSSHAPQST